MGRGVGHCLSEPSLKMSPTLGSHEVTLAEEKTIALLERESVHFQFVGSYASAKPGVKN